MDNSEPKEKQKSKKTRSPKRPSGSTVDTPFVSRSNPLADLLFGSITKEMVEAASRGEPLPEPTKKVETEKDQVDHQRSEKRSKKSQNIQKFSTTPANFAAPTPANFAGVQEGTPANFARVDKVTPANFAGVQTQGFLAIPHNLLDKMFAEIGQYSAFKVYLYLYREAFKRVHDVRETAVCKLALAEIMAGCNMTDRIVRYSLESLAESGWIEVEKRPGSQSIYVIKRPSPAKFATDLKKDHDHDLKKEDHLKKEFSDDDFLSVIRQVYEELTKNTWTSKDTENYKSLPNDLQTEDVIRYMKAIHERTKKPIGSFAYFVKAIIQERKSPKTRQDTISKLRKIVESVKQANVGGKPLSNTDFREQIKEAAAREGIPYTPDLMEEALKPKN